MCLHGVSNNRVAPDDRDRHERRLAFGQRSGLVDDERVDRFQTFERLGVLHEHAGLRAASRADHDRHRRREPERARARDDQHGDGADERARQARLGAPRHPARQTPRWRRARPPARTTPKCDRPAAESARGCAALQPTMRTICASSVSPPTRSALKTIEPSGVERPAGHARARFFFGRHRLAGHHRFVDGRSPFDDDAVDRNPFAGPDAAEIADAHVFERDVLIDAVANDACGLGRECKQFSNRRAGLMPRSELEHLSEQHQRRDDDAGVEVGRHDAVHLHAFGKHARRERRDRAVDVRGADAERDQREHVRTAIDDRDPRALEERPAGPEDDRRRQDEADPVQQSAVRHRQRAGPRPCRSSSARRPAPPEAPTSRSAASSTPVRDSDRRRA